MDGRPFLGSLAVAEGLLTRADLRSGRFTPLFRDVFVEADVEVDLAVLSMGAALFVPMDGRSAATPRRPCSVPGAARRPRPPSSSRPGGTSPNVGGSSCGSRR